MTILARDIMMLADSFAIEKNKVDEVNKKLKLFRDKPGDLDLHTMCELEHILDSQLFVIPPTPTKKQLRKMKLDKLNKICNEDIIWSSFNSDENQWYNLA